MVLWLNIITLFRSPRKIEERDWKPIEQSSDTIVQTIKDTVDNFIKVSQIALNNKQYEEWALYTEHLKSLGIDGDLNTHNSSILPNGEATCHKLPFAPNANFFGRESHLRGLTSSFRLEEEPTSMGLLSVALHGLAGMGKTQIALHFAHQHTCTYPVILWFNSETEESLKQSFSSAAAKLLGLPDAKANQDSENRLVLLKWLGDTGQLAQPFDNTLETVSQFCLYPLLTISG
ncbi:uncharacterized protein N7483_006493 [Penicillium malachiteum]|uniref:uncharacterized protein n=1 Tax=Penicillium malachiteum TaxID=1324776 RepID=UPI0025498D18|nr:uncharacterized protein N7483_006493 [Penicillium malachiteum]KAJ5725136.1 hypothetical protein N7483_006493 [Penicillium malachiteum]